MSETLYMRISTQREREREKRGVAILRVYALKGEEGCNVQLADEIMLISIITLVFIFAHAPVLSNLIHTEHAQ